MKYQTIDTRLSEAKTAYWKRDIEAEREALFCVKEAVEDILFNED